MGINGSGIFSSAEIWARNDVSGKEQTVMAGWEVNPSVYGGATTPRFFVSWDVEGSGNSFQGCENGACPGFVLATGVTNYLGAPISPVSTYNGNLQQIEVKLVKENPGTGGPRWSVYLNTELLGWWPASLFTYLNSSANTVGLGGEVMFYLGTPSSKTEMGSGHYPYEGFRRSAHIRNIQISNGNGVMAHFDTNPQVTKSSCYNVSDVTDDNVLGTHFFFGGPGGDRC